jgi:hypothetical protein
MRVWTLPAAAVCLGGLLATVNVPPGNALQDELQAVTGTSSSWTDAERYLRPTRAIRRCHCRRARHCQNPTPGSVSRASPRVR